MPNRAENLPVEPRRTVLAFAARAPENTELLDQYFEASPAFMAFTKGATHKFERANPSFYEMLHVDSSIIGKTVAEVFPEIATQGFNELLDKIFRTGRPYRANEAPLLLDAPDGGKRLLYITFACQPLRDTQGKVYGILHQGYEVTDAVRARRETERAKEEIENERENFRHLFRQTPEMVCILKGPDHVFEFVNEAHIKAIGFNAVGMSVRKAQPESVEVHGILDDVYRTGRTAELHEIPVTVGDRLRYFNLTYSARRDSHRKINGIMVLGVEVTDQVQAREGLEQALAIRDEFLSIASHELKTPITSLQLQTQMLARKVRKGQPVGLESITNHLEVSQKKVRQLTRLIEDMLDVTRISRGKIRYEFTELSFAKVLQEAYAALSEDFEAADVLITLDAEEVRVSADEFRLTQVITNILTNALKYGDGKPVHVSLKREGTLAVLEVVDHGIGIAPNDLGRIFGRFERAGAGAGASGLGLGLFIASQIVGAHGGSIDVRSAVGKGSTFRVAIPAL